MSTISGGKPSSASRIVRYVRSTAVWLAEGMPVRSQEEIDGFLEVCKECEWYSEENPKMPICNKCGCCTSGKHHGWTNKLARSTEHCPIGKW